MKRSEMAKILLTVWVQWPKIEITEEFVGLWYRTFQFESAEDIWTAFQVCLKQDASGFPPTIGQVNRALLGLHAKPEDLLTSGEALALAQKAIAKFGYYQMQEGLKWIEERSERVAQAVRIIGYSAMCLWETKDSVANRAHFWKVYDGIKDRDSNAKAVGMTPRDPMKELTDVTQKLITKALGANAND